VDDGILGITMDQVPIVRRSRTQTGAKGGIYYGLIRNIHAVADTIQTDVNPFSIETGAIEPYPSAGGARLDSSLFDLWLIQAAVRQISGSGTLTAALFITYPSTAQGWGVDSAGVAVAASQQYPVAFWDNAVSQSAVIGLQGAALPLASPQLRLPDNSRLQFSSTSSALATWECQVLLGIFPVALGQDVKI